MPGGRRRFRSHRPPGRARAWTRAAAAGSLGATSRTRRNPSAWGPDSTAAARDPADQGRPALSRTFLLDLEDLASTSSPGSAADEPTPSASSKPLARRREVPNCDSPNQRSSHGATPSPPGEGRVRGKQQPPTPLSRTRRQNRIHNNVQPWQPQVLPQRAGASWRARFAPPRRRPSRRSRAFSDPSTACERPAISRRAEPRRGPARAACPGARGKPRCPRRFLPDFPSRSSDRATRLDRRRQVRDAGARGPRAVSETRRSPPRRPAPARPRSLRPTDISAAAPRPSSTASGDRKESSPPAGRAFLPPGKGLVDSLLDGLDGNASARHCWSSAKSRGESRKRRSAAPMNAASAAW
jgi:hypothetical protein